MRRTNIVLDEKLIEEARKITGLGTKRDIVDFALRDLVKRKRVKKLLKLEGKLHWDGNPEEMRKSRT